MKAILEFNLPEEREEFETANNGGKYLGALGDLANELRTRRKHWPEQATTWDDVHELFWSIIKEADISI